MGLHPFDSERKIIVDPETDLVAVWKAMVEQQKAGKVKAIGVSNFNQSQIQRLLDNCSTTPENLQVELHAYFQQQEMVQFCREHKITVTAYSPLGSRGTAKLFNALGISKEIPDLFNNPVVLKLGEKYGKTSAQVLLRHTIQKGVAVIPKSTNPGRIQENIQVFDFELSEEDVEAINDLDQGEPARVVDFSFFRGISERHPEFPFKKEKSS